MAAMDSSDAEDNLFREVRSGDIYLPPRRSGNCGEQAAEVVVIVGSAALFLWLRELPLMTLFGLAAGLGRLWTSSRLRQLHVGYPVGRYSLLTKR